MCVVSWLRVAPGPISRSHASAAHQNLAVFRELHFAARQHLSNRSLPQPEGMVHADQRRRLRQSIALDRGIAQPVPEFLGFAVERRSSRNKCPEFPAEPAAN